MPAEESAILCTRVIVSGRVQGVAFRITTQREAQRLGLCGWVRNLPDGRVEATFEGAAEAVSAAVAWCHHGPSWAHVDHVEITREPPAGHQGFAIR